MRSLRPAAREPPGEPLANRGKLCVYRNEFVPESRRRDLHQDLHAKHNETEFNAAGAAGAILIFSFSGSPGQVARGHGAGLGHLDYVGASADGSKIVFESFEKLSCCAEALTGKPNLYLWDRDTEAVSLVGVLNATTPNPPQLER